MNTPPGRRYLIYERDPDGVPYAVEVVDADAWSDAYLAPPDRDEADVRLLRLRRDAALPEQPGDLPPWLEVERASGGVSDLVTAYDAGPVAGAASNAWRCAPWRRAPHASLPEFLDALIEAVEFPLDPPVGEERRAATLRRIAARYPAFASLGVLQADALERWLAARFGSPEAAVDALLLARVEERDRSWATRLRFLREAVAPEGSALAFDRTLLLEQASPRRALSEGLPSSVLASIDGWARRYRFEYDRHYARTRHDAREALAAVEAARPVRETLARLNRLASLGPPEGETASAELEAALDALEAMPRVAGDGALTAGVTLKGTSPAAMRVRRALRAVEQAAHERLRRLAQALSSRILEDEGLAELDRVLRAMQASETAELASVFDDALLARIDRVLAASEPSPLARVAEDFPVVTRNEVDAAVAAFRDRLADALTSAPDGRVRLRATARLGQAP